MSTTKEVKENKIAAELLEKVRNYEPVDGDPLTIGAMLKELPKQVISHGNIYEVGNANADVSVGSSRGTTTTVSSDGYRTNADNEYAYGHMTGTMYIQRCEGEVSKFANSQSRNPYSGAGDTISEAIDKGLSIPMTCQGYTLASDEEISSDNIPYYHRMKIGNRTYKSEIQPLYAVEADVIQDL